uniref:OmpA-like domain-containing protein n=1 Tax=Magnetococcus massalia (strain MO-1) TaxID=451514 RepID=A0A1S7LF56_MAGMO|nr:Conserved protein of unknown function. Similar to protein Mmc1_2246 from MC-1 [Candidatus Magnetococcus massalia]
MRGYEKGFLFIVVELLALLLVVAIFLFLLLDLEQSAVTKLTRPASSGQAVQPGEPEKPTLAVKEAVCPEPPEPIVKVERIYHEDPSRLALQDLLGRISQGLKASGITHKVDSQAASIFLPDLFLFPAGRVSLAKDKLDELGQVVTVLKTVLPCFSIDAPGLNCVGEPGKVLLEGVYVEGHSPQSAVGKPRFKGNWNVAMKRGFSLFSSMIKSDPLLNGLRGSQGHGLFKVAGVAANHDVRSEGRRVELRFVMQQTMPMAAETIQPQP